ncbi:MAG: cation transporter [Ktedonobacteraceae bacterium]|nr:cation transporter [Ktedonobacteraceae bacterium]
MINVQQPQPQQSRQPQQRSPQQVSSPSSDLMPLTAAQRFAVALWAPLLGLLVNLVLVVVKVIGGLLSGSAALLADAGHSGADVANNILVLASLFYARRPADESHPYGHDRAEVLAAMASAFILTLAGLYFGWDSLEKLIVGTPQPSLLALWVAVGTLVIKLVVMWAEIQVGKKVRSQAIQADARDNLVDVFSALTVILGVLGAHLGYPRLDGLAGLVIALLILWNAFQIGIQASHELLDRNLDAAQLNRVREVAGAVEGVTVAAVTGRTHGSDVLVELSIEVDPHMTVDAASALAEQVRHAVHAQIPHIGDVVVELNTNHFARLRQQLG